MGSPARGGISELGKEAMNSSGVGTDVMVGGGEARGDGRKAGGRDAGFAVIVVFRELKTVEDLVIYADTN